jgi:hypothetical protein
MFGSSALTLARTAAVWSGSTRQDAWCSGGVCVATALLRSSLAGIIHRGWRA